MFDGSFDGAVVMSYSPARQNLIDCVMKTTAHVQTPKSTPKQQKTPTNVQGAGGLGKPRDQKTHQRPKTVKTLGKLPATAKTAQQRQAAPKRRGKTHQRERICQKRGEIQAPKKFMW